MLTLTIRLARPGEQALTVAPHGGARKPSLTTWSHSPRDVTRVGRSGGAFNEQDDPITPPGDGGRDAGGTGGTAAGARAEGGRGRVAKREPRLRHRAGDRCRRGLPVRGEPGRHPAAGPV